jgi:Protein of unknown function with PCYCGC motif
LQLENRVATARLPARRPWSRRLRVVIPVLVASLALGGALAGCSGASGAGMPVSTPMANGSAAASIQVAATPAVPLGSMTMPTAQEVSATWKARPGYVQALDAPGQAAYAFALAHPDVLQWMPCYCGCAGIPHRSNLDCFFVRREVKGSYSFEEHASLCNVCVKTANLAQQLLLEGKTVTQIRTAVDATFGGGTAPGTDTPTPPAS